MPRAFVIVVDACGAGALPDAADYGDGGTNTLLHVAEAVGGLELPTLERLGLGNVLALPGVAPVERPATHGLLHPLGPGKDSTTGHWEMMGVSVSAAPVYPNGFPPDVIDAFERLAGRRVIGNTVSEGLRALEEHGERHLRTGELIVYTSQDSVFQVAAHTSVVPEQELYGYCEAARGILTGPHAVGRVIARPFEGEPGSFRRTSGRRDYALEPPFPTYLDELTADGVPVHAVGKVADIFAGRGIAQDHKAPDNPTALQEIERLAGSLDAGLVFANLIDTDQVYGHRKDVDGFHAALKKIDAAVGRLVVGARDDDLVIVCADHGCDPAHPGTDHTREHAPLIATSSAADGRRVDAPLASVGATVLAWLSDRECELPGDPFLERAASAQRP